MPADDTSHAMPPVAHSGETRSNEVRRVIAERQAHSLRTYTPSLAVLARSAGAYHWTPEGRKLADFTSGVLVMNLGHNPTRWWRRLLEYLGLDALPTGQEFFQAVTLNAYNAVTEIEAQATSRLVDNLRRAPGGSRFEQVLWAASGSEAIQKALWAALEFRPGADMILATRHGFHGKKGLAGAVTGSETDPDRDPRVRFLSFPREECDSIARRREPLDLAPYRRELEALHAEFGPRLACLITEPYLGGGGSYHPQPQYLQLLQAFCREHGLLFILDEVQSNFGRTGPMYAFTHYGLEPDIVVLGKGLGNGVAVSAAVGPRAVFSRLRYGATSDTWSANPLSSAAVLATLDEYETTDVLERGQRLSAVLQQGLEKLTELPAVARVRGEGCVWGVECAAIGRHSADDVARAIVAACYLGEASSTAAPENTNSAAVARPAVAPAVAQTVTHPRAIHLLGPLAGKVLRISPPLTMDPLDAADYLQAMYRITAGLSQQLAD